MGETKKRRQTKHRGNAAGMVESRGSSQSRTAGASGSSDGRRGPKPPQPASWNRAMTKALIPIAILIPLLIVTNKGKDIGQVLGLCALAYVMYVPLSYFTDRWMYNRYVKKLSA
jgi:hypothetical protein